MLKDGYHISMYTIIRNTFCTTYNPNDDPGEFLVVKERDVLICYE